MRSADTAAAGRMAMHSTRAMHSDTSTGHAHPVWEGCSDVLVATAAVLATIPTMNAASSIVSGSENRGAFVDDFFGDGVNTGTGRFGGASGAHRSIDGDGFFSTHQELGPLVTEIDPDLGRR